mgnify:CR=1 FL=1
MVDGILVALCADRSVEKSGDVYLDYGTHHALAVKFARDFHSLGFMDEVYANGNVPELALMEKEESDNTGREWHDWMHGKN